MNKHRGRESNIYTVERLIKRRVRMSKVEYLVKWKNWPDKHNTWEPDENILDRELIKSFNDEEERKRETQTFAETKAIQSANANATPLAKTPTKTTVPAASPPPSPAKDTADERVQKPLSVSVPPGSPGSSVLAPAGSRPTSLYHQPSEAPTSGSSVTTAGSSTSPPVSSLGCFDTATISPDGDWHSENRLRKTTLLVATASQSNARQSNARTSLPMPSRGSQFEVASNAVTVVSVSTNQSPTKSAAVTTVRVESTERPKIRLTIPRERLIVCQTADSSQDSSGLLQDLEDEEDADMVENPAFRAPLELPRRAAEVDDGCLAVPPPSLLPGPEICEASSESALLPKVVLSTRRVISSTWPPGKEKILLTKKESSSRHPKKKRRRESGSGGSGSSNSQRRHRSGSSASSCVSFSSTSPSVSPALPSNESPPRIAPLRIQLSRPNSCVVQYPGPNDPTFDERPFYRVATHLPHQHHRPAPPSSQSQLSVPPRRPPPHLEREISITDVTVGDLTIAIKECPTPSNFFGIPSCQLVQPSRPPLAPRRPGVKSVHHPGGTHRQGGGASSSSPMEVADENMEPAAPAPTARASTGGGAAELSVIVEEEEQKKDSSADLSLTVEMPVAATKTPVPDGGEAPPSPPRRASTPIQPPLMDLSSSTSSASTSIVTTVPTTTTPAVPEVSQEEEQNTIAMAAVTVSDGPQNPRSIKASRLGGTFWTAGVGKRPPKRRVPLLSRTNARPPPPAVSSGPPKSPSASQAENVYTFRGDSPPPLPPLPLTTQTAKTTIPASVTLPCPSTPAQGTDETVKRPTPTLPPPPSSLPQDSGFQGPYNSSAPQHQRLPPLPVLSPGGITLCQLVAATTSAMAASSGWLPTETTPPALTPFPSMAGDRAPSSPYSFYPFLAQMHHQHPPSAPVSGGGGFFTPPPAFCPLSSPVATVPDPEDLPIDLSTKR